ncbi:MAG: Chaperone protein DnaK [Phycisphaerae bacterium]|nr:Chaperone protein DnaK [Phycisphaerae bacterium]
MDDGIDGGFDVGNDESKAAYVDRTGEPVEVSNPEGGASVLTCLYAKSDGGWLIGQAAREQGFVDPKGVVSNFKLKLGSTEPLLRGKCAEELVAVLLAYQKELMERQTGERVNGGVITVPAEFDDVQKKALLRACELAGIVVRRMISEPAAASFAYAQRRNMAPGERFAVWDMGGGTLDISVCVSTGDDVRVCATTGERNLGGQQMDEILRTLVIRKLTQAIQCDPQSLAVDALFMHDLTTRVTAAKISLGSRDEVQVPLLANGKQHVVSVTRAEFEGAIADLVERSLTRLDECLKAANLAYTDLTSLFLVGGPSRMPYLQRRVADHTGMVPRCEIDPQLAVAYGAALVAQAELKKRGKRDRIGGDVIPQPTRMLREVTHHAIGVAVQDGSNGSMRIANAAVVPQNTPIPCRRSQRFRLESPDQREALIQILQGDDRAELKDCRVLASLEIKGMPVEAARSARIEVTFDFDENGVVTITARDIIGGDDTSITIDVPK